MSAAPVRKTSVALVAGSAVRRAGLQALLSQISAASLTATYDRVPANFANAPDACVFDVQRESDLTPVQWNSALPALIVLADNPRPDRVAGLISSGACAILSREVTASELELALSAAQTGLVLLYPSSITSLLQRMVPGADVGDTLLDPLSEREQQVLALLADGLHNKEIATELGLSEHTVKFHISSILSKLGASTRADAVARGMRFGLIML
jgi:DNA-binding NarL/FixJ family response regulator